MARMESHVSVAEAARAFPEMIERVHSQGEVFIVEQGGEPMCRIAPVARARPTVRELFELLRLAPRPDEGWCDAVEEAVTAQPAAEGDPWAR